MRHQMLCLLTLLLATAPAIADEKCGAGFSSAVFNVTNWTISPNPRVKAGTDVPTVISDRRSNHMTETLTYQGQKPVRMVDGDIIFADALGGSIGSIAIDQDMHVRPGATYVQKGDWGSAMFERLLKLDRGDVSAVACVRAVIYADGTKQTFP